jgi:hypothetical protein
MIHGGGGGQHELLKGQYKEDWILEAHDRLFFGSHETSPLQAHTGDSELAV